MAHARSTQALKVTPAATPVRGEVRQVLYKPDHPRAIDRYIDYFGGRVAAGADDPCGEALLEQLG